MSIRNKSRRLVTETLEKRELLTANELVPYSYAWVGDATSESSVPSPAYSYNAAGGGIQVEKQDIGQYSIEFEGLRAAAGYQLGHVQVSPYGSTQNQCNPVWWGGGQHLGANFRAVVHCFDNAGNPTDTNHVVSAIFPQSVSSIDPRNSVDKGRISYASTHRASEDFLLLEGGVVDNEEGDVTVRRTSTGRYTVQFAGLGQDRFTGGHVQVTSQDRRGAKCSVASWFGGADFTANVACTDVDGSYTDAAFNVAVVPPGADSALGYAWADEPNERSYQPDSLYSHNPSGNPIEVNRTATGTYQVAFRGLDASQRAGGSVQVSAYGLTSHHCNAASWQTRGTDRLVNVRCYDASGSSADARFTVLALPTPAGDRFEPNDTRSTPSDLGTGNKDVLDLSILGCGTDTAHCSAPDFYSWQASDTEHLNLSIAFDHGDGDLNLELLDASGNFLTRSSSRNDNEALSWGVMEGNVYLIRVWGRDGAANNYSLTIDSEPLIEGDINLDGELNATDIDTLFSAIGIEPKVDIADLDSNGIVGTRDADRLVRDILNTRRGDTNLDGAIKFDDFLVLNENFGGEATWSGGDFTGDGQVLFNDFLHLSRNFGWERPSLAVAEKPAGIELSLDSLFYGEGDLARVTLEFNGVAPPTEIPQVALSASGSGDVEPIELREERPGRYVSIEPIRIAKAPTSAHSNGVFTPDAGETFYAMYFADKRFGELTEVPEDVIFDFGIMRGVGVAESAVRVAREVTLSDDEEGTKPGSRPSGTLVSADGIVQIATQEVMLFVSDETELETFLGATGGTILGMIPGFEEEPDIYRIAVTPEAVSAEDLSTLRSLYGESGELVASRGAALDMYFFVLRMRLEGYAVAVNPRAQYQAAPLPTPHEASSINYTMDPRPRDCELGDSSEDCVTDATSLWAYTELWDFNDAEINSAVLDMGFATNADFRAPAVGDMVECDMTVSTIDCSPGAAQGSPTVGNSLIGGRSWHGTGVVTTIGGVVNNGFGTAGIGGQVVVPMLYKYDLSAYAFDLGVGIRRAVDDGAANINISAGFPCNILLNVGVTFDICTPEGRAGICAVVSAGAHLAATTICATLGPIPLVGAIACGLATASATAATGSCLSTLEFGDLKGPMQSAVNYANRRGVPVIASAGNDIAAGLPEEVRDIVNVADTRLENWNVVPAALPGVIAVGSVNSDMVSTNFNGDRVDTWAPTGSADVAPSSTADPSSPLVVEEIHGTSGAAPYITGLVSLVQAINPNLNPNNPWLSDTDKRRIVPQIRALITDDDNSFSNTELVSRGYADQPERRELIDAIRVLEDAAEGYMPDLSGIDYDSTLGMSELVDPNDTRATADPLPLGESRTGTILDLKAEGSVVQTSDVDWYSVTMPTNEDRHRAYSATITVDFPSGDSGVGIVDGDDYRTVSRGSQSVYRVIARSGDSVDFALGSLGDNVYQVSASEAELLVPNIEIVSPTSSETVCLGQTTLLLADIRYDAPFRDEIVSIPIEDIEWFDRTANTLLGNGRSIRRVLRSGERDIEVRLYGDPSLSHRFTVNIEDCDGTPPNTVVITAPLSPLRCDTPSSGVTGFDPVRGLRYTEIELRGVATDEEDGRLPDERLVWTTDRDDVQLELLGSGESVRVRLYLENGRAATSHEITLTATDSDGNSGTDTTDICVWTLL